MRVMVHHGDVNLSLTPNTISAYDVVSSILLPRETLQRSLSRTARRNEPRTRCNEWYKRKNAEIWSSIFHSFDFLLLFLFCFLTPSLFFLDRCPLFRYNTVDGFYYLQANFHCYHPSFPGLIVRRGKCSDHLMQIPTATIETTTTIRGYSRDYSSREIFSCF